MKVKCSICKTKGYYTIDYTEYSASQMLGIHNYPNSKFGDMKFICRGCIGSILDSIKMESHRIQKMYEPEISPIQKIRKTINKMRNK